LAPPPYDLLVKNVRVVNAGDETVESGDIGITDGSIALVAPTIDAGDTTEVFDGNGLTAFPGVVDAHMHFGIYHPLAEDIASESRAAALGGVTTGLSYIRTGQYYLNQGGPYEEFMPQVLEMSAGRSHVDYGYHVAPMMSSHIEEFDVLINDFGVSSFKIFMFYGGHGLHGRSDDQSSFLMTPPGERYDYAHFEFIMRGLRDAAEANQDKAPFLSLSMHCETAEIMTAYTKQVEESGALSGLEAYSASRPPHSEGLAIAIAAYLADETAFANINLLHLSSAKAMASALRMAEAYPQVNFRREVTVGHLLADIHTANGIYGKVNPPIRPRSDVEALWEAVLAGQVDWVVSDHACCRPEVKLSQEHPDDIFLAKSGFGGTEYLLSGVLSEGTRRGLSLNRIAELLAWNPAQRYGLLRKGAIQPGYDADIALVDPGESFVVRAADSESTQGYSPLEGHELQGRVKHVFLRGSQIVNDGTAVGSPGGEFIRRPTAAI
jgi:allantoinase